MTSPRSSLDLLLLRASLLASLVAASCATAPQPPSSTTNTNTADAATWRAAASVIMSYTDASVKDCRYVGALYYPPEMFPSDPPRDARLASDKWIDQTMLFYAAKMGANRVRSRTGDPSVQRQLGDVTGIGSAINRGQSVAVGEAYACP